MFHSPQQYTKKCKTKTVILIDIFVLPFMYVLTDTLKKSKLAGEVIFLAGTSFGLDTIFTTQLFLQLFCFANYYRITKFFMVWYV